MNHFAMLMQFLRDRDKFLEEICKDVRIEHKIVSFLVCSSTFLALYGGIVGSSQGWQQILASAVKLPALYLITLLICLPTLYFFDVILGSKRTFEQYLTLLLASTSAISVMLFAFAPITLFFRLSINDYRFFTLLNVCIFAFTGFIGIQFFYRGMLFIAREDIDDQPYRRTIMKTWLALYGFVGSQLGWTLRPFFGSPGEPFALFRNLESNFYAHMLKLIAAMFGFN